MAGPSSSGSYDELTEQSTIALKDMLSMLIHDKIPRNEKPYRAAVLRLNNSIVEGWASEVAVKLCNEEGRLSVGSATMSLSFYVEWKEMKRFAALRREGLIALPNADLVERWKTIFETASIEEMYDKYGSGCILNAWNMIESNMKIHHAEYMWANFWSKSDDPLWFLANSQLRNNLVENYPNPFWTKEQIIDYKDMIMTIIRTPIEAKK